MEEGKEEMKKRIFLPFYIYMSFKKIYMQGGERLGGPFNKFSLTFPLYKITL